MGESGKKSAYDLGWNHRLGIAPEMPELWMVEMEEFLRGYRDCNIAYYEELVASLIEVRNPKFPEPK